MSEESRKTNVSEYASVEAPLLASYDLNVATRETFRRIGLF